jgi:5-methyltetrahydrofolate--homocysteine methyltransferase
MTTTVGSMEDTIRLLREQKEDALVVVGGAVLNEEYAGRIGADQYAKDAMATVHFADRVFAAIRSGNQGQPPILTPEEQK